MPTPTPTPTPSILGTFANTLNAGVLGTTLSGANSGGANGLAFDTVVSTGDARLVYDNTYTRGVGLSARHTAGPGGNSYYEWNRSLGSPSVWYGRVYLYLGGLSSGDIRLVRAQGANDDLELVIEVSRRGTLRIRDAANRVIATSIQPVATGAWVRLEWKVNHATGQIELRVFNSPNLTTPTETLVTAAGQTIGSRPARVQMGRSGSQAFSVVFWTDDPALSTTRFVGPVV
ncbi:MAG: hypothetical protein ABI595_06200 [Actinomycetota bacterium]